MTSLTCDAGYHESGTNGVLANYVNENTSMESEFQTYRSKAGVANGGIDKGDISSLNPGEWKDVWYDGTWVKGVSTCNNKNNPIRPIQDNYAAFASGQMSQQDYLASIAAVSTTEQYTKFLGIFQKMLAGTLNVADAQMLIWDEFAYGDLPQQNFSTDSTGAYCWCKMTNYSIAGGSEQNANSALWVAATNSDVVYTDTDCSKRCARTCAEMIKSNAFHRNMLFGSLGANMKCEPNTINLNWNPDNGNASTQSQCIYDGGITLPDEPSKSGYTFGGWSVHQGN